MVSEPVPMNTELSEEERTRLHSLMDLGSSLIKGAPQSVIDWNKAIDEEQRKKRAGS